MIPAGRYKARAIEGALALTNNGNEQVAVLVEVVGGDHAGEQLTWYGHFTEKTVERTFESLRLLGWQGDDLSELSGIDANEVTIIVEHEEDRDGKPRPRVKWINGGGGLAVKQKLEGAAAKAFAQRMRGYALASRQRSGAPQQQRPQNGTRRPPDEPLPFDDDIGF